MARAGHPPPLLRRPDGRVRVLDLAGGPLLGIDALGRLSDDGGGPRARLRARPLHRRADRVPRRRHRGRARRTGPATRRGRGLPLDELADELVRHSAAARERIDDVALLLLRARAQAGGRRPVTRRRSGPPAGGPDRSTSGRDRSVGRSAGSRSGTSRRPRRYRFWSSDRRRSCRRHRPPTASPAVARAVAGLSPAPASPAPTPDFAGALLVAGRRGRVPPAPASSPPPPASPAPASSPGTGRPPRRRPGRRPHPRRRAAAPSVAPTAVSAVVTGWKKVSPPTVQSPLPPEVRPIAEPSWVNSEPPLSPGSAQTSVWMSR